MDPLVKAAFLDELIKISMRIKSNDRMPSRSKANIQNMMSGIQSWDSPHKDKALSFAQEIGEDKLFDLLHSMRRWYSGQTMARNLLNHQDSLSAVMKLSPQDALGVYRGFKVDKTSPLANLEVGQELVIPVTRNHGFSSWSTSEEATNKFSGGGKGKVGIIIRLADHKNITPVLAPPSHTEDWFNELYHRAIGTSFRPKEGEYLIHAPEVKVKVVRVKR